MNKEDQEKYDKLVEEHKKLAEKLEFLYKGFRGVRHENSASEMRYTTIQVYEAHIRSVEAAMKEMQNKDSKVLK